MSELYPKWVSAYKEAVVCAFDPAVFDDALERLGIVPPYCDDPEKDDKVEELRRLVFVYPDVHDCVFAAIREEDRIPLPLSADGSFTPRHLHNWNMINNLIVYGLVFGLDMLEDALNSGVPLEDIVA